MEVSTRESHSMTLEGKEGLFKIQAKETPKEAGGCARVWVWCVCEMRAAQPCRMVYTQTAVQFHHTHMVAQLLIRQIDG